MTKSIRLGAFALVSLAAFGAAGAADSIPNGP